MRDIPHHFVVAADGDLPDYDELDRLSMPTFSDVESLASVPSFASLSIYTIPPSASARDLTQLERSAIAATEASAHAGIIGVESLAQQSWVRF